MASNGHTGGRQMDADDRQEPDDRGAYGYFVVRRGKPAGDPIEVGDPVDVYPIMEPFDAARVQHLRAREAEGAPSAPPLPLAVDQMWAAADAIATGRQDLLENLRVFCPCAPQNPSTLATVGSTATGLTWVVVGRERVPRAFQAEDRADGRKAYLLHPRISTHYDTTRCKHRRTWGVEMSYTHLRIVRLGTPKYGSRVVA